MGRTQFQKIGEWEENISTSSFICEVAKIAKLGKRTRKGFFKNRVDRKARLHLEKDLKAPKENIFISLYDHP